MFFRDNNLGYLDNTKGICYFFSDCIIIRIFKFNRNIYLNEVYISVKFILWTKQV